MHKSVLPVELINFLKIYDKNMRDWFQEQFVE